MNLIDQYKDIEIVDALEERYLAYALTTIMDRALPDVKDGLKPVHRRLLFAMRQLNLSPNSSFKKSARIVGEVMGRFHPHGDQAIYDTLVRLAQDFSVRWPLINGQGNFGNIDGDNAAAMRYTESKLTTISELLLSGIDEECVDFRLTYDEVDKEPIVLPANFPNLLANGSSGIAVGMATSIPPHNVEEICNASLHLIKHRNMHFDKLIDFIPGPDFPTGGEIFESKDSILNIYKTGKGNIRIRAKWEIEKEKRGVWKIVVNEIPYQVNKGKLIEKIAQLIIDKKIPILDDIRDESDESIRLILVPRNRDVDPEQLMEALFSLSDLETRFSVNLNAINNNIPKVHNLRDLLLAWIDHRRDVLVRRSTFKLNQIKTRMEILSGYLIVYVNLDEVIKIIREEDEPKIKLKKKFDLNENQANSILNMRLRSLRKLEELKIKEEYDSLKIEKSILGKLIKSEDIQWKEVSKEIKEIKKDFSKKTDLGKRRTKINYNAEILDIDLNFSEPAEPITVVLSKEGWIKTLKGLDHDVAEIKFKDGDDLLFIHETMSDEKLLIFSSNGKFYTIDASQLPSGRGYGDPLKLLIDLQDDDKIISLYSFSQAGELVIASKFGYGFIVSFEDLISNRKAGKQILNLSSDDEAISSDYLKGTNIAVIGENKKMLLFNQEELPRMSKGKGVRLQKYKEGNLKSIISFNYSEGLNIVDNNGRNRNFDDIENWLGKRGQAGKKVPKGFPRNF
ncbi:MAG: DNA topoisomerase IV subunit A [Pseudomonadota bacterium]|jgi:topoisomerase-4 subunit A|nr:DNA topoisomerase IV subunit A [Hyphomicrobiales bacterium]MEC7890798.1 DNA topoisomerase IV subunit A [Pseudomonadota bacterium]|tara:strand:+ start:713 stop:2917 length:2205 start_codon:yes stop_codon:yes gene_type:complete